MFEYVRLRNFKSFGDVLFNLLDKKETPKKLVLIYGENGIGKSNLASSFLFLSETLRTMDVRDILQKILLQDPESLNDEDFARFIRSRCKDMETLIKEAKMVESSDPMYLEFGFRLNNKPGKYILETNDNQIIHERLEYTLSKNRGAYYDISSNRTAINPTIFEGNDTLNEVKIACKKFWGKHSLLSILMHESDDKADQFIKEQLSVNFKTIISFLSKISCKVKFGSRQEYGVIGLPPEIFGNLEQGEIDISDEPALDKTEQMLTSLFKITYRDVDRAYYRRFLKDGRIRYELMLSKIIAGKVRDIGFSLESTGIQALVQQLPFMLVVIRGAVAIIDEFDTGLHDILAKNLITSLYEHIHGQLIVTTHSTLLMEAKELPKESIYVISESEFGNKQINCITHFDSKIHVNTNIRDQYLLGKYTGVPDDINIDFDALLNILESNN